MEFPNSIQAREFNLTTALWSIYEIVIFLFVYALLMKGKRTFFLDSCYFPHYLKCCRFIWEVTDNSQSLKLEKIVFYTFQNAVTKLSQTEVKWPD